MQAFFSFLGKLFFSIIFRIKFINREKIPINGPCILCLNHKSNLDPIIISSLFKGKPSFLAKEELFRNPILKYFLNLQNAIPVKRGKGDVGAIKAALKALNNSKILTIFPEGTRVKKGKKAPKIKSGVALIGIRAKVPVIPIAINGEYKLFGKITFVAGDKIDLSEYFGEKLSMEKYEYISQMIMSYVRQMQEE